VAFNLVVAVAAKLGCVGTECVNLGLWPDEIGSRGSLAHMPDQSEHIDCIAAASRRLPGLVRQILCLKGRAVLTLVVQ
jgi:hypothetical protein